MLTIETTAGTYKGKNALTIIERNFGKGADIRFTHTDGFAAEIIDNSGFYTGVLVYQHEAVDIVSNFGEAISERDYRKYLKNR